MNKKLKKTIDVSIQGIWLVLILIVIANVFGVVTSENALKYLENYWMTYIYMAGLITGLVMYKREKYDFGAEIIQWIGLGSMIINFADAITLYVVTGKFSVEIGVMLIAILLGVILIVEALKVIKIVGEYKSSYKLMIISACIIVIAIALNFVGARKLKIEVDKGKLDTDKNGQIEIDNNLEELEPYEKYKDFKWGKDVIVNEAGGAFKIVANQLIYLDESQNMEIVSMVGTPIKLLDYKGTIYILTSEGMVYYLDEQNVKFKYADLSEYNVVDIANADNYTIESIYFLTKDGKVIDKNGVDYDSYSFIGKQSIDISGLTVDISFDKDGNVYYYNGLINLYENIIDSEQDTKISATVMYIFEDKMLMITNDGKLYSYEGKDNKAKFIKEKVQYEAKRGEKKIELIIAFEDNTIEIYNGVIKGYDIENQETIDVSSLKVYDVYKHHKDIIWAGVTTNNAKIINNKLYIGNRDKTSEIDGELKSIEETEVNGYIVIYALMEEGVVWSLTVDSSNEYNVYDNRKVLEDSKIINMTNKLTQEGKQILFFLTEDGKLIDENGNQYSNTL